MASTNKGIYYPNEYNAPADVPKDMKELAESVDVAIENIETEQNTKINNLATKNVQQDAEIENLNAKDISLEKEIQNLQNQNTQQTTEIETLKSENTLLKSQIPSETVVRETVHLEDSSNMQCYISPLGASKQETREGYNKFNLKKWFNNAVASSCTKTLLENGVKLDFTAGADAFIGHIGSTGAVLTESVRGCLTEAEALKEYTISLSSIQKCYIGYYDENYISLGYIALNSIKTTFTTPENTKYISLRLGIQDSNYTTYSFTDIQIVEGTESKPYEQYGASPSIEYESPIESVGDNINLVDIEDGTHTSAGVTRVIEKGIITVTGTPVNVSHNETIATYIAEKTETYTLLSFKSSINENIRLLYQVNSGSLINSDVEPQITLNKGDVLTINLRISSTDTITNFTLKPKLVLGTNVGAYSPYGQGSIEIYNGNKNFFDENTVEVGGLTKDGGTFNTSSWRRSDYIRISKDFTISWESNNGYYQVTAVYYDENKNYIAGIEVGKGDTYSQTFEVPENTKYVRFAYSLTVGGAEVTREKIQLTLGSTVPTNYTPHQSQTKALYTQQPFRSIGDVKDRFVKVDGVWYEEHSIYRKIFDGTETFTTTTTNDGYIRFHYTVSDIYQYTDENRYIDKILCSHFRLSIINEYGIAYQYKSNLLMYADYSSVDEFKSKLTELYEAGTPLYVDYVLAEPILIPCTPEQVEVLESFNTYKNITNISSDSIGELEVFYYKDIETLNKNNEERILALENAVLGGN